ncbi:Hva22-like protein a [Thalictrum thalictroides]|uniref:Hva22-like protein a n=1 Tax=Thalictrum thalictroides TaxID=46969 RepID=A0A7J6WPP2_THATH|nr:Hva22-like protein a [Thalictrum thalictroides]
MGLTSLLIKMVFSTETFHLIVGPIINLVYPLYASIRVIESSSNCGIQQWLTYWVLFTFIRLFEVLFGRMLQCLLIWPYAKAAITFWLVLFGGVAHVYENYVKSYFSSNSQTPNVSFNSRNKDLIPIRSDESLVAAEKYIQANGAEALAKVISEAKMPMDMTLPRPNSPKRAQREWTCALCVVTTTSEKDLMSHFQGRKHNAKEEVIAKNMSKRNGGFDLIMQGTGMVDMVENYYQIKEVFVRSLKHHINPFARPPRWCTWEKPKIGWTKLNTDGSLDLKNAGLGGLLRDHLGRPSCGFVTKSSRDGIFSLEIWAIWRGLILALGQGVKSIWVESDSMSAVQVINKEWPYPLKYGSCLKHIWKLLNNFENFQVSHSWREANQAADHLAKMNLNARDVVLWPADFPESLCNIIKEDAEGKVYLRV